MKSCVLWDITPCSPLKVNRRLGVTCRLHIQALLATCFTLVSCLACSSTLKMEATCFSETSVELQRTAQRHIPEDITSSSGIPAVSSQKSTFHSRHSHRCEILKSNKGMKLFLNPKHFCRDSALGVATGYGVDGRVVGVRGPVRARIFASPRRPGRFWGPPSLLSSGYRGLFPRG
jgi:hypothetical protein